MPVRLADIVSSGFRNTVSEYKVGRKTTDVWPLPAHTHTRTHIQTHTHTCTEREGQRGEVWLEITNSVSCLQIYDTIGQSKFVLKNLRHYTVHPNMVGGKASPQDL